MISFLTNLDIADNSGAKTAQCIKILKGSQHKCASIGDTVVVAIKKAKTKKKVKKGEVKQGVVVRVNKNYTRYNNINIRFNNNAIVLINNQGNPIGTRIFGPVLRELRKTKWMKILTMAPSVI